MRAILHAAKSREQLGHGRGHVTTRSVPTIPYDRSSEAMPDARVELAVVQDAGPGPGPGASSRAVEFHRRYATLVHEGASDAELVELVFEHCHAMVFALANRIVGSAWEAEDLTQSVFEWFVEHLHVVRDPARIPAFLKTCAVRAALRHERRGRWRRARLASVMGDAEDPRTRTNEELIAASVRTLLERLDPQERAAVVLKFIELHNHEEVAALMGVSVSTARRRIESGRDKLVGLIGETSVDELLSSARSTR
jgi:RNA polymerase sigma factor (sigma-70 family)